MRTEAQHIIQKLYVELELTPEQRGISPTAIQQQISERVHQDVLLCIEHSFAKVQVPEGVTLRIEKLNLDLGQFRSFPALVEKLMSQIENNLSEQLAMQEHIAGYHPPDTDYPLDEAGKVTDAFLFFLQTGRLPWWAYPVPVASWEKEIIKALNNREQSTSTKAIIQKTLKIQAARKRFLRQFSPGFVRKVLLFLAPASTVTPFSTFQKEIELLLRSLEFPFAQEAALQIAALEAMCQNIVEYKTVSWASEDFLQQWVNESVAIAGQTFLKKVVLALQAPQKKGQIQAIINQTIQKANSGKLPVEPEKEAPNKPIGIEKRIPPRAESADESIYISNAGAVLLAPFLPVFFERLGLLENERLKDADRAACILQYLTTGQAVFAEFDLFLPKILCNIETGQPIITTYKITRGERQEALRLLRSMISYWKAIKNTSPAGLQVNFLQRNGMIQPYEDGWKLIVEQQTFDILLEELPWTISYIQLPWMEKPLWVDWA